MAGIITIFKKISRGYWHSTPSPSQGIDPHHSTHSEPSSKLPPPTASVSRGSSPQVSPTTAPSFALPPTTLITSPDPPPTQTTPSNACSFDPTLQTFLNGRSLPLDQLPFTKTQLDEQARHGMIAYEPSLIMKNNKPHCERCGNSDSDLFASYDCARCGKRCLYCRKCLMMGVVKECTPLVSWTGPPILYPPQDIRPPADLQLSPLQKQASEQVATSMLNGKDFLTWAVTGAGKTEILFEGIAASLSKGMTVALATPRADVVHELTPRLKKAFPQVEVLSLFGGSEDRGKQGQLVISTTHQLLRYKAAFDVMIVDEVDAFPYSMDASLKFAVQRARKQGSSLIYLTATPDGKLKADFKRKRLQGIQIAKRHHGFPLPRPTLTWFGNWQKLLKNGKLPSIFIKFLNTHQSSRRPLLIFVPSVSVLTTITALLKGIEPLTEGVHANDPERREKVVQFREKAIPILVTTTILERGITIPSLDVVVFGADDWIFTESALVQIAGRVGRAADDPRGDIIFYHYGKTDGMIDAVRHIDELNRLGGFTK